MLCGFGGIHERTSPQKTAFLLVVIAAATSDCKGTSLCTPQQLEELTDLAIITHSREVMIAASLFGRQAVAEQQHVQWIS
jgi:hypothetical protein